MRDELIRLCAELDRARAHRQALEATNVAGWDVGARVDLHVQIKRAEDAWADALSRYNAALKTAARPPAGLPKRGMAGDWCADPSSGCGNTGRCPLDPVCGN